MRRESRAAPNEAGILETGTPCKEAWIGVIIFESGIWGQIGPEAGERALQFGAGLVTHADCAQSDKHEAEARGQ
ncbi:hypothetical protein AA105894_1910 [Asaia spathodeae NBRC 105894]|nr:hypothetical protein AA105894_1910 [Asaia spathodeae NBRC 105894]